MAIIHSSPTENFQADALALQVLAWLLQDERRADRFLSLTGLGPDELRARLGEVAIHRAVLDFLLGHEPDLLAASESLGVDPAAFGAAARELG
jgi:hypothetical protein